MFRRRGLGTEGLLEVGERVSEEVRWRRGHGRVRRDGMEREMRRCEDIVKVASAVTEIPAWQNRSWVGTHSHFHRHTSSPLSTSSPSPSLQSSLLFLLVARKRPSLPVETHHRRLRRQRPSTDHSLHTLYLIQILIHAFRLDHHTYSLPYRARWWWTSLFRMHVWRLQLYVLRSIVHRRRVEPYGTLLPRR